jgi:DNA-binding NarL/FixJ family response regulator
VESITVVIADDEPAVRAALVDMLNGHPALSVVGVASDAASAVRIAQERLPRVAVVDVRMPGGGGLQAIRGIRQSSPGTRIVAYSAADDRTQISRILGAGADRYVVKGARADQLLEAILATAEGSPHPAPLPPRS